MLKWGLVIGSYKKRDWAGIPVTLLCSLQSTVLDHGLSFDANAAVWALKPDFPIAMSSCFSNSDLCEPALQLQACAYCLFVSLVKTYHTQGSASAADEHDEDLPGPHCSLGVLLAAPGMKVLWQAISLLKAAQSHHKASSHVKGYRWMRRTDL